MVNIDKPLEDYVNANYSMTKLMQCLRKLAKYEYAWCNYGQCSRRCIEWMKLYKVLIPYYSNEPDIYKKNTPIDKNDANFREKFMISQMKTSKYEEIMYWYTECRKHLVGMNAFNLIQDINIYLPEREQYEVFLNYNEITKADGGLHNSRTRYNFMLKTKKFLDEAVHLNSEIQYDKALNVLVDISVKPKPFSDTINDNNTNISNTENKLDTTSSVDSSMNNTDNVRNKVGERLTHDNACIGMVITYNTKKGVEYGKIKKVCDYFVEIDRLKRLDDNTYVPHKVQICKSSQNKPAFTRVITIVSV